MERERESVKEKLKMETILVVSRRRIAAPADSVMKR